jgi:hypothetical protein
MPCIAEKKVPHMPGGPAPMIAYANTSIALRIRDATQLY